MSQTTSALSKAANAEYKRKQKEAERAESRGSLVQALVALVVTLAFIVPVYLVIVNSLKPHAQIFTNPAAIPIPPTFQNFTDVLTRPDGLFWSGLLNSTQLTLVSTVLSILFAALMAHYMVRRKNRISKFLFILIPMGLMIPTVTTLMPLLTVLKELNLVGSVFGLMLVYIAGTCRSVCWSSPAFYAPSPWNSKRPPRLMVPAPCAPSGRSCSHSCGPPQPVFSSLPQ